MWYWLIGGIFILGVAGSIFSNPSEATPNNQIASTKPISEVKSSLLKKEEYQVVKRVVDGDTIELENGEKVRYIGINTPETVDPRKSVECFGKEASNKNKELVEGKKVRLEKDISDRDKYNRLLRYVYLENGTFINLELVKQGYAQVSTYPPDVKFQSDFQNTQDEAKKSKLGLWADNACQTVENKSESKTSDQTQAIIETPKQTESTDIQDQSVNNSAQTPNESSTPTSTQTTPETTSSGVVKKSTSGICHAPGTTYYNRTKNFIPYNTIDECIASGGRLPLR